MEPPSSWNVPAKNNRGGGPAKNNRGGGPAKNSGDGDCPGSKPFSSQGSGSCPSEGGAEPGLCSVMGRTACYPVEASVSPSVNGPIGLREQMIHLSSLGEELDTWHLVSLLSVAGRDGWSLPCLHLSRSCTRVMGQTLNMRGGGPPREA